MRSSEGAAASAIPKEREQRLKSALIRHPHQLIGGNENAVHLLKLFATHFGQLFEQHARNHTGGFARNQ
jgi:hypothetical protein